MSLRRLTLSAALLFLASFFLYLKTHCASVYPDDSGETAVLAATLSIGHPPGYPLHTLSARIFNLLPLGEAIVRTNIFAAFLAALCVAALALLFPGKDFAFGILAAGLFGAGSVFWHNSGIAKGSVYMLNNLLTLLCLHAIQAKKPRLFWLFFGLGLAHHYMSQAVMLPCYLLLLSRQAPILRSGPALMLPGLSLYAFLFLRADLDPPINWHNIQTLNDLWFFLGRAQYAAAEFTRSPLGSLRQLGQALYYMGSEGGVFASLLAAPALPQLWLRKQWGWLAALAMPLAAVTFYLNLSVDRLDIMQPYLFPAYLAQALCAGWGALWLAGKMDRRLVLGISSLAVAVLAAWRFTAYDRSRYHFALDNIHNLFQATPRGSALFAAGDATVFPVWYLQYLRGERKDIAMVGAPVLPMRWVRDTLARRYPQMAQPRISGEIGAESIDRLVGTMLDMNLNRLPLYFSYNQMNAGIPHWKLVPQGPSYAALPKSAPDPAAVRPRAEAFLMASVTRGFEDGPLDKKTRSLLVHDFAVHHNALGNWLEEHKDLEGALLHYEEAGRIDRKNGEYPYNCGNALHMMMRLDEAVQRYKTALERQPRYEDAWYNLAATYLKLGRTPEACDALRRILVINPKRSDLGPYLAPCPKVQ